jgi:hypothetical protein
VRADLVTGHRTSGWHGLSDTVTCNLTRWDGAAKISARRDEALRKKRSRYGSCVGRSPRPARKSLSQKAWMMASHIFASWNQLDAWLRQLETLRRLREACPLCPAIPHLVSSADGVDRRDAEPDG